MANVTTPEKRGHKRFKKSCEVEFQVKDETYRGISDNFSIDGLLIMTDNPAALDSVVSITLRLPNSAPSKLIGRVKRLLKASSKTLTRSDTFKGGMGVEIIKRDSNYLKFFMSLLSTIKL